MKRKFNIPLLLIPLLLIMLLASTSIVMADGSGGGHDQTETVNGYTFTLNLDTPVNVGENLVSLKITDPTGMPVIGAIVEISLEEMSPNHEGNHAETDPVAHETAAHDVESHDAGQGMAGMDMAKTPTPDNDKQINSMVLVDPMAAHAEMGMIALGASSLSGEYTGTLDFESEGEMVLKVHATIGGELLQVNFPINIEHSPAGAIALGSFGVVNIAILISAYFLKKTPSQTNFPKR